MMSDHTKYIVFALIQVLFTTICQAQPIDTAWTRTFYNGGFDSVNWVSPTSDNGFIIVGCTRQISGYDDINLIKTDSEGNQEWNVVIGDELSECGFHVFQTNDGGYLISANSYAYGNGGGGVWIIKTDNTGSIDWTYPFVPENRSSFPLYAIQTFDSGYAITGRVNLSGTFNDAFILLLDKNGNFIDYENYTGDGDIHLQDGYFITQMQDSGFIVAGNNDNYYSTSYDFYAFRTDKLLNLVWDSSYAITSSYDIVQGACQADNGIIMVGTAGAYGYAMKIDYDGNTVWSKDISYYFTGEDNKTVCPTIDGGFMVGGWIWVTGHRCDFSFIKMSSSGDAQWQFTVGESDDDHGEAIIPLNDGSFVMAGTSASFYGGTCSYLVKVSPGYICGDASGDGAVNIADVGFIINWIFNSGPTPEPLEAGDANGDGSTNIADAGFIINWIFFSGPAPCEGT